MAILRNQTAAERRARVFGLFGACMGLAAAIGPLVGGELTERFGWRAVFAANLPVIAVSLLLVLMSRGMYTRAAVDEAVVRLAGQRAPRRRPHARHRCAADVRERRAGGSAASAPLLLVVFPILGAARGVAGGRFLAASARGAFFGGGSIIALQNMAMYPLLFQLPVFFDRVRHLGARTMGQALLALTVAMMLSSVAGGRLTERIGARAQTLVGSLVALAGVWWFADFEAVRAPLDVMPGMLLIGVGRRHDVAACAGGVDEHGRTRAGRHGWRRGFDDALHRRRGWHDGARRAAARLGEPRVASASGVRVRGRADRRGGDCRCCCRAGNRKVEHHRCERSRDQLHLRRASKGTQIFLVGLQPLRASGKALKSKGGTVAKKAVKRAAARRAVKKRAVKRRVAKKAIKRRVAKKAIKRRVVKKAVKRRAVKKAVARRAVKRAMVKRAIRRAIIANALSERAAGGGAVGNA